MINRKLIRVKIVQLTYAYYQNGHHNMDTAEKELLFSLSKAYDLYNYLLGLIVAITQEERRRVDIATRRAEREGTETPSQRFAFNKFATQLEENKQLNLFMEDKKMSWENDVEAVRKLCDQIEQSPLYQEYMMSDAEDYETDRELWRRIYRTLIQGNEDLDAILEEKSLYWNDDKEIVDTFVLKTIKRFDPANKADQELLPEYDDTEDREYALKLFRSTILNADTYQRYMSETSRNWNFSRLAYMDVVLMQIAIAAGGLWMAAFLHTDYNYKGVFLIIVLYSLRLDRKLQAIFGAITISWEAVAPLAFIPIWFYNGERGRQLKYFFYWFYPVHLLILGFLRHVVLPCVLHLS